MSDSSNHFHFITAPSLRPDGSGALTRVVYCGRQLEVEMPIESPTVADVVDLLLVMPPDAPFKLGAALQGVKENVLSIALDTLGCVRVSALPLH
jgi:hypothetical protein